MATQVGTAVVKLSFDGKDVSAQLSQISSNAEKQAKSGGSRWGSAFAVAAGNLLADGIKKVGGVISGAMDSAMSRADTLNNFPKVMQSLGYSAEESASSIQTIGDKLDGLPTSLDGMASDVQKLAATMGNLNSGMVNATSVGLSLNNMFLAGGKGTERASAAMEQYNQMLARGKVDMQSWNSLVDAAPGQMNQLAESLLGAGKNQQDLYQAMQNGTVTFDQFNETLVRLNEEGGENFASFSEQAIAATDGFQTGIENIRNSLNKVVAAAIQGDYEALGKSTEQLVDRISAILPKLVDGFVLAFGAISQALPGLISNLGPVALEGIVNLVNAVVSALPAILTAIVNLIPDIIKAIQIIGQQIVMVLPDIIVGIIKALTATIAPLAKAIQSICLTLIEVFTRPDVLSALFEAAIELLMSFVQAIPVMIRRMLAVLPTIINNLLSFLTNPTNINTIIQGAIQLLMAIVQAIPTIINALVVALPNIITSILNFLLDPGNITMIINAAIQLLMGIIQALPTILTSLVTALPDILASILGFLLDPNNLQRIVKAAVQLFFGIVKAVPQILGALLGAFGNLVGNLWNWITQKFGEFAGNFGNFIGGIFKRAINGVLSFIENFINGPIDLINGAIDLINNIPGVDIGHVPRVYLPRLAQGGVATSATAAIFGEAGTEAVLPLERNQDNWAGLLASTLAEEMHSQGVSGTGITVYMTNEINNDMDADDIGRKLMTSIRRAA